ncbi:MAG: carboxyl transferase domain-containing protein [Microthrixaceae bacterium]
MTDAPHEPGTIEVTAPLDGTCVAVLVAPGDPVAAGATVVLVESMKTEHPATAPVGFTVTEVHVATGEAVRGGDVLLRGTALDTTTPITTAPTVPSPTTPQGTDRPDLAEVLRRRSLLEDTQRPAAVARRAERGRRTARANVTALLDDASFDEYGGLAVASQRSRRGMDELIERTPADGLLTGTGTIGGRPVAVLAYDATVLAGTQGFQNHRKTDRLLDVARRHALPVVVLAEGGGGRPGDVDAPGVSALDVPSFARFAELAGQVPTVAVVSGYCFAGNAALAACCDVVIATDDANLGMAGPAMIEGGGLGVVAPTDIGPVEVQAANGTVDVRVPDEVAAVDTARRLLLLALRPRDGAPPVDDDRQAALRDAVPLERRRAYDVRAVVRTVADEGTVTELGAAHAPGMITALARVAGRAVGILANDPTHLGGAIDVAAARAATRFIDRCDHWELPIVALCDTPGLMVGPEAEAAGQVRASGELFRAAARATVPWVLVVLRKCYGLGAQAMAGGSLHEPVLGVSWPTGEFGGMGLEGAVRLGFRRELDAIEDPAERAAREAELVERAYAHGAALNVATHTEIDDVIDPADTRRRIVAALTAARALDPPR